MTTLTTMGHSEILRIRLEILKREHRDLDEAIHALADKPISEPLTLRRLKKHKLSLKDKIAHIQDELTPDIIAQPTHLAPAPPMAIVRPS